MTTDSKPDDDVTGELIASALLVLFALGSTGLLLGTALGAVWLLG
jgi:hypothetical protein